MNNRNSFQSINKIYFWTATINQWQCLLQEDSHKQIIIDSLKYLSDKKLIVVYAFVIMPNHIHVIWEQTKMNGGESPRASFMKYTGHILLAKLKEKNESHLYRVDLANKRHEIWKRDSLAIELFTRKVTIQKLNYVHANPVKGRWKLAIDEVSYYYSSAKFYDTGIDDFGFLHDTLI